MPCKATLISCQDISLFIRPDGAPSFRCGPLFTGANVELVCQNSKFGDKTSLNHFTRP